MMQILILSLVITSAAHSPTMNQCVVYTVRNTSHCGVGRCLVIGRLCVQTRATSAQPLNLSGLARLSMGLIPQALNPKPFNPLPKPGFATVDGGNFAPPRGPKLL